MLVEIGCELFDIVDVRECFQLFGRCGGGARGDGDSQSDDEYEEPSCHGWTVSQGLG